MSPESVITLRTRAELSGVQQAVTAYNALDKTQQAIARSATTAAQNVSRLDAALKGPIGAADSLKQHLQNAVAIDPRQAVSAINQIIALEKRAANDLGPALPRTLEEFGSGAIDQFKAGLLGVVGPAALVTGGIAALTATARSFKEAFEFKAELDSNRASISAQLIGIRDSGEAFKEAGVFAEKYKLTQEDTTTAIQASVPLLRQSKASLTDVLTVLAQLQVLKPEQGIQGAAFALAELQGGQTRSLATRFNIPIAKANELKQEIQHGGDAVQVLGTYLDNAGIGADALAVRTQGVAGALNDAKIAAENLKIAQGKIAESAGGIFITEGVARQFQGLANLLNGDAIPAIQASGKEFNISAQGALAYATAIASGKSSVDASAAANLAAAAATNSYADAQRNGGGGTFEFIDAVHASTNALSEEAKKKLESTINAASLADEQKQLASDSTLAAQGLLGAGDQALLLVEKYGIAADSAQFLINQQQKLSNATALADQRKGEQTGTDLSAAQFDKFSKLSRTRNNEIADEKKKADDKAKQDQQRLNDLQNQNRLINAKTSAQKIAELERQKGATNDVIKRQELQNQIDQERQSGSKAKAPKGLSATDRADVNLTNDLNAQLQILLDKQKGLKEGSLAWKQIQGQILDVQKKIADEQERGRDAALNAQIAGFEDQRKRLEEDQRTRAAQNVINSSATDEAQKARARIELGQIPLEQEKRRREIEKQAREGGIASPVGASSLPGAASVGGGPAPVAQIAGAGAGGTPLILQLDGKQIATILLPYEIAGLRQGVAQVQARGG